MGSLIELENCADYLNITCNTLTTINGIIGPVFGNSIIGTPDVDLNAPTGKINMINKNGIQIIPTSTSNQLQLNALVDTTLSTSSISFMANNTNSQNYVLYGGINNNGDNLQDGHMQLYSYSNNAGIQQLLNITPPNGSSDSDFSFTGNINLNNSNTGNIPYISFSPSGYQQFSIGATSFIDNKFHITSGSTFSTSDLFILDSSGNLTIKGNLTVNGSFTTNNLIINDLVVNGNITASSGTINVGSIISSTNDIITTGNLTVKNKITASSGTLNIVNNKISATSGTLNIVGNLLTSGNNTTTGNLIINSNVIPTSGTLNTVGNISASGNLTIYNQITPTNGTLNIVGNVSTTGNLTVNNQITASSGSLALSANVSTSGTLTTTKLNISNTQSAGQGTLNSLGVQVISTNQVTSNSLIFCNYLSNSFTIPTAPLYVDSIIVNTYFQVNGSPNSNFFWMIIN